MRTIDRASDPVSTSLAAPSHARPETLLRRLASITYRLFTRRRNLTADLSEQQLRDIGLDAGGGRTRGIDRASRQDALLREAHAKALLLSRNIGGR